MDNEFNVDLITLISDEGEEIEFEILDIVKMKKVSSMYSSLTMRTRQTL